MRTLLLASVVVVIASIAVSTQGRGRGQGPGQAEAQKPAGPDLLAIGGKDTAWFMDRVSRPDTEFVEQRVRIVGHLANGVRLVRLITPPGAPVVERDNVVLAAESGKLSPPSRCVSPQPHDKQERLAFAVGLVIEVDPVYSHECHTAISFRSGLTND